MSADLHSTATALPKLPGYNFSAQLSQPVTFAKSHIFGFNAGVPQIKPVVPLGDAGETVVKPQTGFSHKEILARHPHWNALSDKVLRFYGYFTERVNESSVEKFRVRKVTIQFNLGNATVSVIETPAVPNSGLRPGTLVSKHVEDNVHALTLAVGGSFEMRGRTFTIVDCDAATRRFYETMGVPQADATEYPPDEFESAATKPKPARDADHIQMKRNVEMQAAAASGRQASLLTPEERERARNFLDHDREVLSFKAVWQGRSFRVNFYVADGTVAVMNELPANSGRDPNSVFLRRQKAPVGHIIPKAIDTVNIPRMVEPQYVTARDFQVGSHIVLFEREFYLYDCDEFTTKYYLETFGIEQVAVEKPETEGERKPVFRPMDVPPYTGYGSDEDSLQSFRSLVPKPPKKDYARYFKHASDVLRFHAVFDQPAPEDGDRVFIFCYYVADNTISVYEHAVRNSGHTGGKIFSRSAVKSIDPEQLVVGNTVRLNGRAYRLVDTDERTKAFLRTGVSMGTGGFAAEDLLLRLRHALGQRFVRVTEAYRHFSSGQSGISAQDLTHMLKECEIRVDDPAKVQQIMEAVDRDRDGSISLSEFIEHVMGQPITRATPVAAAPAEFRNGMTYEDLQKHRAREEFSNKVLRLFITKLEARRAFIVDTFRIVTDRSLDGLIGVDTFRTVVQDKLGLKLTDEELDALVFKFFYVPGHTDYLSRRLTLREFRRVVEQ